MSKSKYTVLTMLLAFILGTFASANAKTIPSDDALDMATQDGTYDVPGNSKLKLRVIVHRVKPLKPSPTPPPQYCTDISDSDSDSVIGSTGWKLPNEWTYRLNPSSVPASVGEANLGEIALLGFNAWNSVSGVSFTRGVDTSKTRKGLDGQNIIAWGTASGGTLGVTYTWYYPDTGVVTENDTIMNKAYKWTWTPFTTTGACFVPGTYDTQNILTHELGHWLGLDDHYTDEYINNTMYGYGAQNEIKKDTLTHGDALGIQAIYGIH